MASIMVCNLEVAPIPPAQCPAEAIVYYQNFWDSGLTNEQVGVLMASVLLLWSIGFVVNRVRSMF